MKLSIIKNLEVRIDVAPVRERGLKSISHAREALAVWVAPVRERGLKLLRLPKSKLMLLVAPVRERGLKCSFR